MPDDAPAPADAIHAQAMRQFIDQAAADALATLRQHPSYGNLIDHTVQSILAAAGL